MAGRCLCSAARAGRAYQFVNALVLRGGNGHHRHASSASSPFTSTVLPLARISSIMFSAITMGMPSSISCMVRYKLRSMLVASTMLMMPSGLPSIKKNRALQFLRWCRAKANRCRAGPPQWRARAGVFRCACGACAPRRAGRNGVRRWCGRV